MIKAFKKSSKCWVCDNVYVDGDIEVSDYFHISRKYLRFAHRDCIIEMESKHEYPIIFHNLKTYDSNLIIQELGKFNLKIKVPQNRLEQYISFNINN